jgi:hypothetical protein
VAEALAGAVHETHDEPHVAGLVSSAHVADEPAPQAW